MSKYPHSDEFGRFLRLPEVMHETGLSRSQIYALMKTGQFPNSIKLSKLSCAWTETAIADWKASRVKKSDHVNP